MKLFSTHLSIVLILNLLVALSVQAMDLTGQWKGYMAVGQQAVPIIFNVTKKDATLAATMDSPMQGAKDIPVKSVEVNDDQITFSIAIAGAQYEATIKDRQLEGVWKQSGQAFPLIMAKAEVDMVKKN